MKVRDLKEYSRSVELVVKVISKEEVNTVYRESDGLVHRVAWFLVGDETGSIILTLWDEAIDKVEIGDILKIPNGYVSFHDDSLHLNVGRYGSFELLDEAPFDEVNLDNNLST